ncbi:MAG: NADP-dependent malic enzyme [Bacilli bacterium]|nr:NADP-dependent malic enzyme [Bacilli bacterium]MDD4076367.1 NADP-dependent malic enzyme [Bacilli bacterium]
MNKLKTQALDFHKGGKVAICSKVSLNNREDLSLAYTPGVAYPCLEIAADPVNAYLYTSKSNTVAVISDGSAVLGLGDIGPLAAMPVMEGKCLLFKKFAGIDAIPIVLATQEVEEIIRTVQILAPSFGGINLEDISFPRCVEIETRLIEALDIPVFHDDQRGTAVVTAAALISACKLVNKKFSELTIALLGLGAAGSSVARLLKLMGVGKIYACNSRGIVSKRKPLSGVVGKLLNENIIDSFDDYDFDSVEEIMNGADVFIGVSRGNLLSKEAVNKMGEQPIVFALANPDPEISFSEIKKTKAYIYATGRSDYPNQINNVLAFPGIFKGALTAGHKKITEQMCIDAAYAIAGLVNENRLSPEYIIPSVFDTDVVRAVSKAIIHGEGEK